MRGRLTVLYGSQTGCAEEVAHGICAEATRRRYEPICLSTEDYDVRQLPGEGIIVLVISTAGEGEVPETVRSFWEFLLRRDLSPDSLAAVVHACFGLGDSSYPKFNFAAKRMHRRLAQLGSKALVPLGLGDDQDALGLDHALAPWLQSLWDALAVRMPLPDGLSEGSANERPAPRYEVHVATSPGIVISQASMLSGDAHRTAVPAFTSSTSAAAVSKRRPYNARVLRNTLLTAPGIGREVRHVEIDVSGWGLSYSPGDALAVQPLNPLQPTLHFLAAIGIDPQERYTIESAQPHAPGLQRNEWTALDLFRCHLDIFAVPRRPFFALLAHFATLEMHAEKLAELGSTVGAGELLEYATRCRRTYAEVLMDFTSARPPIAYYLDLIPPLRARYFSIASSPEVHPGEVHLTVSVVRYKTRLEVPRFGVCSSYLAGLRGHEDPPHRMDAANGICADAPSQPDTVEVWLRKGCLRLPASPKAAIIMVGPGTGVAPFRSFVQTRQAQRESSPSSGLPDSTVGDAVLFFGCRRAEHDFLYQREWEDHVASGALQRFVVAFSREPGHPKVYVQHRMREAGNGEALWRLLLLPDTHVYIAGAANQMPKAVRQALREIAEQYGGMDLAKATDFVKQLEACKRLQCETW